MERILIEKIRKLPEQIGDSKMIAYASDVNVRNRASTRFVQAGWKIIYRNKMNRMFARMKQSMIDKGILNNIRVNNRTSKRN